MNLVNVASRAEIVVSREVGL